MPQVSFIDASGVFCGEILLICMYMPTATVFSVSLSDNLHHAELFSKNILLNNHLYTHICRFGPVFEDCSALPASSPLMQGMATCHSLTTIEGSLSGDPLDIKMFQATNWVYKVSMLTAIENTCAPMCK